MSSVLDKLARAGLTEEQMKRAQARAESMLKEASKNHKLRKELLEKLGFGPWSGLKSIGSTTKRTFVPAMGQALSLAGAGALLTGGTMAARGAYEFTAGKLGKAKAYKEMIEARPELKDRDPKSVQRAFDSLYRFNPDYAKDPLVAGSFVDSISSSERLDIGTVNALVSSRKGLEAPDMTSFLPRADVMKPEELDLKVEEQPGKMTLQQANIAEKRLKGFVP